MASALAFALLPSRIGGVLLGSLGALGATLAMVGLYAVVSYTAARRTAEIGVRIALGSTGRQVVWLVIRDGLSLVGLGAAIGMALAVLVTQPLSLFLEAGLNPIDPASYVAALTILAVAGLLACWWPARRAAMIEPTRALRID